MLSNFSFSHSVFLFFHSQNTSQFSATFILLPIAFSLDHSNILPSSQVLTLSQTSPGFYVSAVQVFKKHSGKRRNCSLREISPFPTVFSTRLDNFLPLSSNLKVSSAKFIKFNPFPNKPWFLRVCSISLLKILWEKEKLLVTSNFSFSHSVFYLFG